MSIEAYFGDRIGVLATMHHKEQVMAPLLEAALGIQIQVPPHFNTDRFGTFTRETPRCGTQLDAARTKAQAAISHTGATLAFASEGTFGPHPFLPTVACNRELVLLLDTQHNLEIVGQSFSTDTNYRHQTVKTLAQAQTFAQSIGFPDHALVVMPAGVAPESAPIFKGITCEQELAIALEKALAASPTGQAHLETDMRALYNPTRMNAIAQATQDLIQTLQRLCPHCACPGFSLKERQPGLPCGCCGLPTTLARAALYHCPRCTFSETQLFPDGITEADPGQCDYCNP